jgi:hypothetical protein
MASANKLDMTSERGTIARGKYTLPKSAALLTKELEVPLKQLAK